MTWETKLGPGVLTRYDWGLPGSLQRLDPYLAWLDVTGPERHLPLSRYRGRLPMALVVPNAEALTHLTASGLAEIAPHYLAQARALPPDAPLRCTGLVEPSADALLALQQLGIANDLGLPQSVFSVDDTTSVRRVTPRQPPPSRTAPAEVVIGIIDDGCAFAHEQFCYSDESGMRHTRVEWLWDQGIEADAAAPNWDTPPEFGYGRQTDSTRLDAVIASSTGSSDTAAESAVYAQANHLLPASRPSHGVAVMALAAGRTPPSATGVDAASTAAVVFVQLPRDAVNDTSAGWLSVHVQDAVAYIHAKAGNRPVVVNLSFGGQAGAHDGSSLLEQYFDDSTASVPNRAMVIAAGNGFASACHASHASLPPGKTIEFEWWLESGDPSDSFLEIHAHSLNPKVPASIAVRVTPFGVPTDGVWVTGAEGGRVWQRNGVPLAAIFNVQRPENERDALVLLCVAPTLSQPPDPGRQAPASHWRVELRNDGAAAVAVDAWIERDDSPFGKRRLRQSTLRGFGVSDRRTLNSIANGSQTIVVGGCRASDGSLPRYSASGPTRGAGRGVTLVAPCESSAHRGALALIGPRSGTESDFAGTSMAAPLVTRAVATILAQGKGPLTTHEIKVLLNARLQPPASGADLDRVGQGRLKTP